MHIQIKTDGNKQYTVFFIIFLISLSSFLGLNNLIILVIYGKTIVLLFPAYLREPLIIHILSLPRRRESRNFNLLWIPAFAGMTFLEETLSNNIAKECEYARVLKILQGNPDTGQKISNYYTADKQYQVIFLIVFRG